LLDARHALQANTRMLAVTLLVPCALWEPSKAKPEKLFAQIVPTAIPPQALNPNYPQAAVYAPLDGN